MPTLHEVITNILAHPENYTLEDFPVTPVELPDESRFGSGEMAEGFRRYTEERMRAFSEIASGAVITPDMMDRARMVIMTTPLREDSIASRIARGERPVFSSYDRPPRGSWTGDGGPSMPTATGAAMAERNEPERPTGRFYLDDAGELQYGPNEPARPNTDRPRDLYTARWEEGETEFRMDPSLPPSDDVVLRQDGREVRRITNVEVPPPNCACGHGRPAHDPICYFCPCGSYGVQPQLVSEGMNLYYAVCYHCSQYTTCRQMVRHDLATNRQENYYCCTGCFRRPL